MVAPYIHLNGIRGNTSRALLSVQAINIALLTECETAGRRQANIPQSQRVVRATPVRCL
jgi:hypothetical protein